MSDQSMFPIDMQAYVQEFLDAWRAGDTARVDLLVSPAARDQLSAIPASFQQEDWAYSDSEGGAGSTYLTWRNAEGERMVFRFLSPGVDPNPGPDHQIREVIWNP